MLMNSSDQHCKNGQPFYQNQPSDSAQYQSKFQCHPSQKYVYKISPKIPMQ